MPFILLNLQCQLAIRYHPDHDNSDEGTMKFQDIKLAYEILGGAEGKKRQYDEANDKGLDP